MAINKNKIVAQAQKFVNKGQFEKAIIEYQKLLKEEPEDIRTWLKVGDLYTRMGSNTEATQTYMKVAEKYTRSGFHLKAVAVYKQILKLDPMLHEVYEHLSESYLKLGLASEALIQLEQLVELLQRVGNDEKMLGMLERMAELDPSNVATRLRIAEHRSSQGDVEGAIGQFVQAATQLREQQRMDDFLKVAERMLFHDPSQVELAVEIAELYLERKQFKKALSKLQLSFMKNPRDLKTLRSLAEAFTGLKQPEKAISVYREMALLLREKGDLAGYNEAFEKILEIDPENTSAKSALNRLPSESALQGAGAAPQAAQPTPQVREMAIPSAPPSAPADVGKIVLKMLQEVGVLLKYGLKERAVDHVRQILKIDPENVQAHETLKNLLLQLDKKEDAVVHLLALADIYSKEDPKAAVAYLTEVLDISPENNDAIAAMERVTQKPYRPASLAPPVAEEPQPAAPSLPATRIVGRPQPLEEPDDFPSRVSKFPDSFGPLPGQKPAAGAPAPAATPAPAPATDELPAIEEDDDDSGLILGLDDESELSEEIVLGAEADELSEELILGPTDELTRRLTPEHLEESPGFRNIPAEDDVLLGEDDEEVLGIDLENEPVLGAELGAPSDTSELTFGRGEAAGPTDEELPPPLTFESIAPPSARSVPPAASMPPPPPSVPPKPRGPALSEPALSDLPPPAPTPVLSVPPPQPRRIALSEPGMSVPPPAQPATPAPAQPAEAKPAGPEISGEIEEIEFYAKYGLIDEATAALKPLLLRYPDDPRVHAAAELVRSAESEAEPATEAPTAAPPAAEPKAAVEESAPEPEPAPEKFKPEEIAADIQEHTESGSEPPGGVDEFDEVFEKFKRGVKERVADTDFATHYDLGLAYREMGLIEDAISEFRIAAGDPTRAASTATMIGLCLIAQDRLDDAIIEFMKGLEEDHLDTHNELGLLYELGKAYQIKGQTDDAVSCFEEIQERDPKFADVTHRLNELSGAVGGLEQKKGLFS